MLIETYWTKTTTIAVRMYKILLGARVYRDFVNLDWLAADINNDEPTVDCLVTLSEIVMGSNLTQNYYFTNILVPTGGPFSLEIIDPATHEVLFTGDTRFEPGIAPSPVSVITAPPNADLQRIYGTIKELGILYAEGDTVTFTATGNTITGGAVISNQPKIAVVDATGSIYDPDDTLLGVLIDKGASITMECKRGTNPVVTYYTKSFVVTGDDTKDLTTY